jgi:hypothetical protein
MQVCKPCPYTLVEAVEPFKLHPMSMAYIYEVFERLFRMWMGIWILINMDTTIDAFQVLWELAVILPDASVQTMPLNFGWGCRTFQTASHIYVIIHLVFERLLWLWMGIWLHTHTITPTDTSPDLWKLAEILPDASLQIMPTHFSWGCRTFQTTSQLQILHICGTVAPSQVVDGHMDSHSHHYQYWCFSRFVRVGCNPTWWKSANHATTLWLRL